MKVTTVNPFNTVTDLSIFLQYWKDTLNTTALSRYYNTDALRRDIENATELHEPINDPSILEKYSDLIKMLMSAIFPAVMDDGLMLAAHRPFHPEGVFATPAYLKVLPLNKTLANIKLYGHGEDIERGRMMVGLLYILEKVHGVKADFQIPIIVGIPDMESGLERVYKVELDYRFADVDVKEGAPEITEEVKQQLMNNIHDPDFWIRHLSPEFYTIRGIVLSNLIDITDQEMLSSIKYYLLKRDAVTCGTNFLTIQDKIRALFKLPELQLGIVFFDPQNNIISNTGISEWNSFMLNKNAEPGLKCSYFSGSIYDQAYARKQPVVVEDVNQLPNKTIIEESLVERNVRNIVIAPLVSNGTVLGVLELVTPHPGMLNAINSLRLEQVLPMFTAAIQRVLGDLQNEVRALIQKECTAIHPSVEWKFLEAGYAAIGQADRGKKDLSLPEIVFNDVYPIFGLSDIRNSSTLRNAAIRDDLMQNLSSAHDMIDALLEYQNMPILHELVFRIESEMKSIESGLAAGAESSVITFLKEEVNDAIRMFENHDSRLNSMISAYFDSLDSTLGIIYDKRKSYEESLTRVNQRISELIDTAEESAQQIIPHYFEKYKTDGVEYNAYVGQSLLQHGTFNPLHLRNFRLWQLITMCNIASEVNAMKDSLSHPLDIAQLILVHSDPLSIRFRQDEKHFDVDGAYNIRYEIVKKRIDKAYVQGGTERLTQPGKISIVYSHNQDATEYRRYFGYLLASGFIEGKIEELELEELQGARGLRALRVTVAQELNAGAHADAVMINDVLTELEKV